MLEKPPELLENTFLHLPGIGPVGERKLWAQGVQRWDDLAERGPILFSPADWSTLARAIDESREKLAAGDYRYFLERFPRDEHWRVISERTLDRIAYLDIETTGMGYPPQSQSTSITFYYQGQVLQAHDSTEKYKLIRHILDDSLMLSTFFGQGFDLPFLSQEYGFNFVGPHLDLCFWLKRHGFKGGLKKVQTLFPEIPSRASAGMDGMDAVRLWRRHQRGEAGALESLLHYNAEDTIVLEALLVIAFNLELKRLPELGLSPFSPLAARPYPELKTRITAR